ncbi:MAG: enoyl-CoA hydratase-related protein [Planctomycetota bacterium]
MSDELVTWANLADGSAQIVFDETGRPVNVLRAEVFSAVSAALDGIARLDTPPTRVVLRSGKPGTFIAGADLRVIRDAPDDELDALLKQGQDVLDRIEALPMPTAALIGGAALGGGLEVALACDARVVADGDKPILGLPEIGLGLVPGWGGTVRLVERLGVERALPWLLSGNIMTPAQAQELGLAEAVVPEAEMSAAAKSVEPAPAPAAVDWLPVLEEARDTLDAIEPIKQRAARAMLDTVEAGLRDGRQAGLDMERRSLVALRNTDEGRELIGRFFSRKKKA